MEKYLITLPNGEEREVDSVTKATEIICSKKVNWKTGSGDASIANMTTDGTRELQLMCRPTYGFILSYFCAQKSKREYLFGVASRNSSGSDSLVSVFVGGDYSNYPSSLFHGLEETKLAIAEFMQSNGPPASICWVKNSQRPTAPEGLEYGASY